MEIYNGDINDKKDNPDISLFQINSIGSINTKEDYLVFRNAGRNDYHIVYVAQGICNAKYENKSYKMDAGTFIVYPPKAKHWYVRKENSLTYWIHFKGFGIKEVMNDCNLSGGVYAAKNAPGIEEKFLELISEHYKESKHTEEKGILISLLYKLSTAVYNDTSFPYAVQYAVSYISKHYSEDINIRNLANSVYLSYSRFNHLFKEYTGISPLAYKQKLQLDSGKNLLLSTNLSITKIACLTGFNDSLYFSRLFKKKTGLNPSSYRQKSLINI